MIKNKKILILLILIISGGVIIMYFLLYNQTSSSKDKLDSQQTKVKSNPTNPYPHVVSTNPSPLEDALILPTQIIQITFSDPVVNTDELKHKMDPEDGKYKLKLSDDRKTLFIIPSPTFDLGIGYTFFILSNETKFDQSKKLDGDIIYHFRTISYNGV